jgi:ABC-type maltose transport system permease subunit
MKMRKTLIALVIALGMVCFVGSASAGETLCLDSYWDSVQCDLDNSALSELAGHWVHQRGTSNSSPHLKQTV